MTKYFLLLSLLFLAACKNDGTETGNPGYGMLPPGTDASADTVMNTVSYRVLDKACVKVRNCASSAKVDTCMTNNYVTKGFGEGLGLKNPNKHLTMYQIMIKEIDEEIIPDQTAAQACLDDLDMVVCKKIDDENAYEPMLPNPYSKVSKLLPASCKGVFP